MIRATPFVTCVLIAVGAVAVLVVPALRSQTSTAQTQPVARDAPTGGSAASPAARMSATIEGDKLVYSVEGDAHAACVVGLRMAPGPSTEYITPIGWTGS